MPKGRTSARQSRKKTKDEESECAEELQKVDIEDQEEAAADSGDDEMNGEDTDKQSNGPQDEEPKKATKSSPRKSKRKKTEEMEEEESMEVEQETIDDEEEKPQKRQRTSSEEDKDEGIDKEDEEAKRKEEEAEAKKKAEEEENRRIAEEKSKEEECKRKEEEKKKKEEEKRLAEEKREQERIKKKKLELEKYWKPVKEDPTDFTGWTYLLQYVDQGAEVEAAREAFDEFFKRYPYCYGYWKKYADYEKKKGNKDNCEKVFERGLEAIPLSVDLWIHYMNYLKSRCLEDEGIEERIRTEYLRAIDVCGLDFRSSKLWEQYIKWETEKKGFKAIMAIYSKLLKTPTQMYSNHWTNFQKFVNSQHPKDLLSVDDFLSLRKEVLDEIRKQNATGELLPAGHDEESADVAPGDDDEEAPPGEDDDEQAKKSIVPDEEMVLLREKIIQQKKEVHQLNEEEVSKRWTFEEGIKRPYFHVKPLEKGQLKNWREYLDFEISAGDEERILVLFERCLIACAFYEEFWHKFIHYLLTNEQGARLRLAFNRACTIHLPKKPALHMQWAAFEEKNGDFVASDRILETLEKNVPDLLQLAYRRINLARREGNLKKVHELYTSYLEKMKADGSLVTHMTIKYARFCHKIDGDLAKAKTILEEGLDKVPSREKGRVYLQLVDLGFSEQPVNQEFIVKNLDLALECAPTDQDRLLFSQRKVEFLEDFGTDIIGLQTAIETHLKLLKSLREQETKRRAAEEEALQTNEKSKKTHQKRVADLPDTTDLKGKKPRNSWTDLTISPPGTEDLSLSTTYLSTKSIASQQAHSATINQDLHRKSSTAKQQSYRSANDQQSYRSSSSSTGASSYNKSSSHNIPTMTGHYGRHKQLKSKTQQSYDKCYSGGQYKQPSYQASKNEPYRYGSHQSTPPRPQPRAPPPMVSVPPPAPHQSHRYPPPVNVVAALPPVNVVSAPPPVNVVAAPPPVNVVVGPPPSVSIGPPIHTHYPTPPPPSISQNPPPVRPPPLGKGTVLMAPTQPKAPPILNTTIKMALGATTFKRIEAIITSGAVSHKSTVYRELMEAPVFVMCNEHGNYVMQKLLEKASPPQKNDLFDVMERNIYTLSCNKSGFLVVLTAIQHGTPEQVASMARRMYNLGIIGTCSTDELGKHSLTAFIKGLQPQYHHLIVRGFLGSVEKYSCHYNGSYVIQILLKSCSRTDLDPFMDELFQHVLKLIEHPHGNYVIQTVIDYGPSEDISRLCDVLQGSLSRLSVDRHASNVIEKLLKASYGIHQSKMIDEICESALSLCSDKYGNFVVQQMLEFSKDSQRNYIRRMLEKLLPESGNQSYAHHVLVKINKLQGHQH